jgi:serine/threonine-protein kinase
MDFIALQSALAGQYFLERELGRGGMGVVYLAREARLDRSVAVKVLPPSLAARPELRERFLREARTAAKLSHPNIVPVYRVDEAREFVYLVMGYVDGGSLGDRLRERGTLPATDVARVVREVGWALAYAHARGVVHRDVKPDNILLDRETGRALVTDFGIAQVSGPGGGTITGEGLVMGTAQYMSPEQAAGEPLDGRSDLYSLGVVAYQALAGRPPFDAPTVAAVLAMHLTQPPPVLDRVPPHVAGVVHACLAKSADDRPATGEAVADLLDEAEAERQLPAPLRTFAEARDPLVPLYALWCAGLTASAVARLAFYFADTTARVRFDPVTFTLMSTALIVLPVIPFAAFHVRQAARALAAGYGLDDLRHALAREAERVAAATAEPEILPRAFSRAYRIVTYAAIAGHAPLFFHASLLESRGRSIPGWLFFTYFLATLMLAVTGSALGITWPGRPTSSKLVDAVRRRFWDSRAGAATARVLSRFVRRRADVPFAPRATEMAIGLAADGLFAALPAATRAALADLPALVRRLEREAEAMRVRTVELSDRLAAVSLGRADLHADARRDVAAELRAARDAAERRRDAALGALESIRLDLLRLQSGVGDAEPLTALVDTARRIGDDVDALLDARRGAGPDWRVATPPAERPVGA